MKTCIVCLAALAFSATCCWAAEMTYQEAKARIIKQELPAFWVGDCNGLGERWEKLSRGKATIIAQSPGGRPLHLVTYGEAEPLPRLANFNSAIGAQEPGAFADRAARKKPVVFFIGPVHGHEVEALTGLASLIEVMETGKDLRGRDQPELRRLGDRCRLLILPCGNPDGVARFEPRAARGMTYDEFQFWGQGAWADGTIAVWPRSKRLHPMKGPAVGFVGCYFNDAGINPMHDEFFAPMSQEAPAILRVARDEAVDLAVSLHSHQNPPAVLRPAYLPLEVQEEVRRLAERCYALYDQRKLPYQQKLFTPQGEGGKNPASFNLISALYHTSGATSFTFECPHGIRDEKACQVTFEEILDIQLSLYEAMLQNALEGKGA
jgi:hypothetical protein